MLIIKDDTITLHLDTADREQANVTANIHNHNKQRLLWLGF